jgi:serine O-acetyltransferase
MKTTPASLPSPAPVSATEPDWSRERCIRRWDPARRLLRSIRSYQHWKRRGGILARIVCRIRVLEHHFWSAVAGCEIPLSATIGGGLLLPHPNGIVIHPDVRIGPNCLLFQQVTLGTTSGAHGVPCLGGHVDVGAGARILGPVRIGNHARIGANAVVLSDVPAGATAVGIPARVISVPLHGMDRTDSDEVITSEPAESFQ